MHLWQVWSNYELKMCLKQLKFLKHAVIFSVLLYICFLFILIHYENQYHKLIRRNLNYIYIFCVI